MAQPIKLTAMFKLPLRDRYCHHLSFLEELEPTVAFHSYWKFITERNAIHLRRLNGKPPPWTDDPVLREHKFTNVFRAADRVSQYCIKQVIYEGGSMDPKLVFFRVLLFKFFNNIETWELLTEELGPLTWKTFDYTKYRNVLDAAKEQGQRLFSGAYIQNQKYRTELGAKHRSYLALLEFMMRDGVTEKVLSARTYEQAYQVLWSYPLHGNFIAMQHLTDLNYSPILNFDEDDFIIPGPGCLRGIQKCFGLPLVSVPQAQSIIYHLVDQQEGFFDHYGLTPVTLFGRRMHAIDVQNCFCEVDKYARVAHPEFNLKKGGKAEKIKQNFSVTGRLPRPFFPPKWNLNPWCAGPR